MLDVRFNAYLDPVLREHLLVAARRFGIPLHDLEDLLDDEADAVGFLKECGVETWHAYVEEASARVDYVGWIITGETDPHAYG